MKTIVIDTNVWVTVLGSRSSFQHILLDLRKKRFILALSAEIMLEYEEIIIRKFPYSPQTAEFLLSLLIRLPNVHFILPTYRWQLISVDPDDNKFVDTAIVSGADYIVTEDRHFKVLASNAFPVVNVINLETFSELLKNNDI